MGGRGQSSMSGAAKRTKGRTTDALAANGRNDAGMTAEQERQIAAVVEETMRSRRYGGCSKAKT